MTVHFLRPREVGGYPIDYQEAHPEIGGIDVIVWRDEGRHDGFLVNCRDWQRAHELVDVIRRETEGA
ncbi:MAG: hypothetical protein ACX93P_05025 [Roseovarius sp.]